MRVVNRFEFLRLPPGTVYASGTPSIYSDWCVKIGNAGENDWYFDCLSFGALDCNSSADMFGKFDAMEKDSSVSFPVDFHQTGRDGGFYEKELYCILEEDDVRKLIERLQETLPKGQLC